MTSSKSLAIIGGGISGLSAAYYLLENSLKHGINIGKIYLFEEQSRFGGWLQSLKFDKDDYFELGPRTISLNSYAGNNALLLADSIGLSDKVKHVSKYSPSFKRRYIAIDNQLRLLPNNISDLFLYKKPFKPFLFYLINDLRRPIVKINSDFDDISVYDFFKYRFGEEVVDYLINSLCIGITGGNSRNLSMRSIFSSIFQKEQIYGSVIKGMLKGKDDIWKDLKNNSLIQKSINEKWAVFSFENGIETLPKRLIKLLNDNDLESYCHLLPGSKVTGLNFNKNDISIEFICDSVNNSVNVDYIFSSIPAINLAQILPNEFDTLRNNLMSIKPVHMALVCLQYEDQIIEPDKGFGFLVPPNQNSNILGVTFDSCIFPSKFTKMTVMLGGYRFEDLFSKSVQDVDKNQILDIALKSLKTFLNIDTVPSFYHVAVHQNCIPQYTVGHNNRLRAIENEIKHLNISLLGASYYGFSVPDTILNSKIQIDRWIQNLLIKT